MGIIKKIIKNVFRDEINNYKGKRGEKMVERKLNPFISFSYGITLPDYIFLDEKNNSHQIDHIEIRKNGIFVIEVKNYIGAIYGEYNSLKWRQVLNNQVNYFYNPIKQNNSHIYHLSKLLNNKYKINSIIVFANNNADNIDVDNVINLEDLKWYISSFNNGVIFSKEVINEIYDSLVDKEAVINNKEHIANINKLQASIKEGICPRCGARLIKRSGKHGIFYGCSNYPKCSFKTKKEEMER